MGLESWTEKQFDRKREEGLRQGLEKGLQKGLQKGLEKGLQEGLAGIRRTLRLIVRNQTQTLCAESTARLDACKDLPQLERWVDWVLQQPRGVELTLP